MLSCLWHAGLVLASLWGPSDFLEAVMPQFFPSNTEKETLADPNIGAAAGALLTRGNPVGAVFGNNSGALIGSSIGAAQDRKAAVVAAFNAQAGRQMRLEEIVQMAQVLQSDAFIIEQINKTGSVFRLNADDVNYLQQQRVSEAVINHMQSRTYVAVSPRPIAVCGQPMPALNAFMNPPRLPLAAPKESAATPSPGVTEFGPPLLSRVPYLNRLFRTVGYSPGDGQPFERIGVDFSEKTFTPIPVQPWTADRIEERFVEPGNVTILPPIKHGQCLTCDYPPGRDEILRAMPPAPTGLPYLYSEYRDNVEFDVEKLVDRVGPPTFYPLIGPAQMHYCHWKCTMYFRQTTEFAFPIPFKFQRMLGEVVYIDKNRLHLCAEPQPVEPTPAPMSCPAGGKATPNCTKPSEELKTIPQALLRQPQPEVYRVDVDDALRIFVKGAIDNKLVVNEDGALSLPQLKTPLKVKGMTCAEVRDAVLNAYQEAGILAVDPKQTLVLVSMLKPRSIRVQVIRQDQGPIAVGTGAISRTRRGIGRTLDLAAYENDVLNALIRTGGLPGPDAYDHVTIVRKRKAGADPFEQPQTIHIPLRLRAGEKIPFSPEDIILKNGDTLYVDARDTEFGDEIGLQPPISCPAGGKATPKIVATAERAEQIQFDVIVAEINRSALPKFKFRWAEYQAGPVAFGVLAGVDGFPDTLVVLREAGLMKTISQPNIATLSGRKALVTAGGQIAVPSPDPNTPASLKQFGVKLELLPTLQANGKIHLDACYENSWLDRSKDITISGATPITIPGFDSHCARVAAELEPGKTLAIGGLMRHETSVTLVRIPFLSDLPVCGDWFVYRELSETRQETVILITPHIVKNRGDNSETSEPPVAAAKAERGNRLSLEDVIALAARKLSSRIIIRQMELADAKFDLSVDDLIRLAEAGVDEEIISAMQERR